ncbi:hypothetical protein [Sphingomonas turrisvirgatae]|uniref:hypothetical protein n=1 Tax=Sphingomonas turrisvirgatae TaxID=1888892 RepID=UPI00156B9F68|nr:hypothetical protein [Sphingomonas turrisvirgatae]
MAADDVAVVAYDGAGTPVTLPSYSVTLSNTGGTVTFDTAPASGLSIYIRSEPDFRQQIQFQTGDKWLADPVNEANDRAAARDLYLKDQVDRSFKVPLVEDVAGKFPVVLPGGGQGWSSGTGADAGLRTDLADPDLAGALIAFEDRDLGSKAGDIVSVLDKHPLAGVGMGDAADAVDAAVDALPDEGGRVLIPRGTYIFNRHFSDHGKPVLFELESGARLVGPIDDWLGILTASGSGVVGMSAEGCVIELRAPSTPLVHATLTATLTGGGVSAVALTTLGTGYASQPEVTRTRSPTRKDAGFVAKVNYDTGQMQSVAIGAVGEDYLVAPTLGLRGGGYGAFLNDGARRTRFENLFFDMKNIPNACGIHIRGGWYDCVRNCNVLYNSDHDTALFLAVESYTLGEPGPGGSYGGAYVNTYEYVRGKRLFFVGHDTSTGTTSLILQPECLHISIHACVYFDVFVPVLQPLGVAAPSVDAREALFDFLNVDAINIKGGDFETPNRFGPDNGRCIMFRSSGSCRNVRIDGTGTNAFAGTIEEDRLDVGSRVCLSDPTKQARDLKIALADEWRQPGWDNVQRSGFYWEGNAFVVSSTNVTIRDDAGTLKGTLDDEDLPGQALVMDISRQLYLLERPSGPGEVAMTEAFKFDAAGLAMMAGSALAIGGKRVVGARGAALPADATDLASALTLVNSIKARLKTSGGHGLVED